MSDLPSPPSVLVSPSSPAPTSGGGTSGVSSSKPSSPFGGFSPSNAAAFINDKLAAAKRAIEKEMRKDGENEKDGNEKNNHNGPNNPDANDPVNSTIIDVVASKFDTLTTPTSTSSPLIQLDLAFTKVSQTFGTKFSTLEEELRLHVTKFEDDFHRSKVQLKQYYEDEKLKLEMKYKKHTDTIVESLRYEYETAKKELHEKLVQEVSKLLIEILDEKLLPELQQSCLDPLMPLFVQELILDVVTSTWPDVKEEIFDLWHNLVLRFEPIDEGRHVTWWPNFPQAIKCSFLYHTFPYDRTIWWRIRTFSWWIWNAIAIFPLYGIQGAYFIFLFLCLDKSDEFQMVNFIMQFKGLQFVTLGIINCMVGAAAYYGCVTVDYGGVGGVAAANQKWAGSGFYIHRCDQNGPAGLPGSNKGEGTCHMMSFTIWAAMWLLPTTTKKGLRQLSHDSPPRYFEGSKIREKIPTGVGLTSAPVYGGMGGKMRLMIFFDAFILFLICLTTLILLFTRPYRVTTPGAFDEFEWLFREDIFWLKTLYGLASFPFAIFLIPIVSNILLHTRPTGYNRAGQCVPIEPKKSSEVPLALVKRGLVKDAAGATGAGGSNNTNTMRTDNQPEQEGTPPVPIKAWGQTSDESGGSVTIAVRSHTNKVASSS